MSTSEDDAPIPSSTSAQHPVDRPYGRPNTTALPSVLTGTGPAYRLRLVASDDDLRAAQRLRFRVFNLEMGNGLAAAYGNGRDEDAFDPVCDHLIVEDTRTGLVVGTYRLQTGRRASEALGYYSEREFDFAPFEPLRDRILELGRACIDERHRSFAVLSLLWNGIAAYASLHGARYLIGCSSLTSQDESAGAAAWQTLRTHAGAATPRTVPHAAFACALSPVAPVPPKIPRLLSAYLTLGAQICGPPAIDREFGTIDFLTWVDLDAPRLALIQKRGRFTGRR